MRISKMLRCVAGFMVTLLLLAAFALVLINFAGSDIKAVTAEKGVRLPVIMYHSVLKDKSRTGAYVITPAKLESDLKYLRDNGYESVTVKELIAYVENNAPLPAKPVMLTFDDGYINNLVYAEGLLAEYDFKGVLAVVGEYTDAYSSSGDRNAMYAYLHWSDVTETARRGVFELQNHSYHFHSNDGKRKGAARIKGEPKEEYTALLKADLELMDSKLRQFGASPTAFVYPFGELSQESFEVVKKLYKSSFSCREHINTITRDPDCLYLLGRFNRRGDLSTEEFMEKAGI